MNSDICVVDCSGGKVDRELTGSKIIDEHGEVGVVEPDADLFEVTGGVELENISDGGGESFILEVPGVLAPVNFSQLSAAVRANEEVADAHERNSGVRGGLAIAVLNCVEVFEKNS